MSQGNVKIGVGRTVAGIALGALLALATPMVLLAEIFSLMTALMLPSLGLIALYRWAGRGPALFSAALTLALSALLMGGAFGLITLFMALLPPLLLLRMQDRPFFFQLRVAIAAFGVGMLAGVAVIFFSFGGNMIERTLGQLPNMVRALPQEYIAPMLESISAMLGRAVTAESFYELYDSVIDQLIPLYQLHLPAALFGGALLSALACTWLSNRMRAKRGLAAPGSYVPLRGWALPASTTGGIALILAVSWVLTLIGMRGAETVYFAVYAIASVAFGAQTLGSAARRLRMTALRPGAQRGLLTAIALLGFLLLPDAMLVYGAASAVFGTRGALQQRAQNRDHDGRFGGEE